MNHISFDDIRYTIVPFVDEYIDNPLGHDKLYETLGLLIGIIDRSTETFHVADTDLKTQSHWSLDVVKKYGYSKYEYEHRYWYVLRGHPDDASVYVNDHLIPKSYSFHVLKYDLQKHSSKRDWIAIVLRSESF